MGRRKTFRKHTHMLSISTASASFVAPTLAGRVSNTVSMTASIEPPEPEPYNPVTFTKSLAGVAGPLGFFDPAGFCSGDASEGKGDVHDSHTSYLNVRRRRLPIFTTCRVFVCSVRFIREAEIKHGRVAMLAAVGFAIGESFHPLFGGDIDVPSYVAFQQTPLQTFWPVVLVALAVPEVFSVFKFQSPFEGERWALRTDSKPGDLGFDPLGLAPKSEADLLEMQTKELNNGRLAMIAIAGMVGQELASGAKLF